MRYWHHDERGFLPFCIEKLIMKGEFANCITKELNGRLEVRSLGSSVIWSGVLPARRFVDSDRQMQLTTADYTHFAWYYHAG